MKHTECKDCELSNGDCGYHFKMDGTTNYDIASLSACDKYGNCEFFKAKPINTADNERPVVFNITEIDGLYDITTEDSRGLGYGCRGRLSSTEVLATMQEMSKWMHDWVGFDVVFAFKEGKRGAE